MTITKADAALAAYVVRWVLGDEKTKRQDESALRLLATKLERIAA